jgi:phosphoserine phosphatase
MAVKLVLFDMDGVLVDAPSSWVTVHRHFGVKNEENSKRFFSGQIDESEFMRSDIKLWKDVKENLSISDISGIFDAVPLMNGAVETVRVLKGAGVRTSIISGGIDLLADRVASLAGIDSAIANGLEADRNGMLTGQGILRVRIRDKSECALKIMKMYGVMRSECVAVGDGPSDLKLFGSAGKSIAFNAWNRDIEVAADHAVGEKDLTKILDFVVR